MTDKAATVNHMFLPRLCSQRLYRQSSSLIFGFDRDIYINIHIYINRTYICILTTIQQELTAVHTTIFVGFPSTERTQL